MFHSILAWLHCFLKHLQKLNGVLADDNTLEFYLVCILLINGILAVKYLSWWYLVLSSITVKFLLKLMIFIFGNMLQRLCFSTLVPQFQAFTVTLLMPAARTLAWPTPWFHQVLIFLSGGNFQRTHLLPTPPGMSALDSMTLDACSTARTRASKHEYPFFPRFIEGDFSCSGFWFCMSHLVWMFPTWPLTFPTRVNPPLAMSQKVWTASLPFREVLIQYTPLFAEDFFWSSRFES